jgi:hypothetical protein
MIERRTEYNKHTHTERERKSLRVASFVAPVVVGPPGPIVTALFLRG